MIRLVLLALTLTSGSAAGLTLELPQNAQLTGGSDSQMDSYALPVGPFANGEMQLVETEGLVSRKAWRVEATGLTTLQLLQPLRDQIAEAGYDILFECNDTTCGGFDFRFGMDVLPEPVMHVDLGDFRYLAARHEELDEPSYLGLLISRSATAGFIQVVSVGMPGDAPPVEITPTAVPTESGEVATPTAPADFATVLERDGHAPLSDLRFATGSSELSPGPYASLQALADYLTANPDREVALVGHTDSQGPLDTNIALSRRRATSVLERLVNVYAIPRRQLEAQGMGYLAPVANNATEEGRRRNRRVEVIITSTE